MRVASLLFRHRFWMFAAVFAAGFSVAAVDHTPTAVRLAHLLAPDGRASDAGVRRVFWAGALLAVAAAALRTWASAYLRAAVVHDARVHAEALVADGPYRHVRNPLYLGGLLLVAGFATIAPVAGAVVMVAGVAAVTLALVHVEETALAEAMPARFAAYRRAVPRILPALAPRLPAGKARPTWPQALAGEAFFWSFALGAAAFAATLDARWAGACALAGVAVQTLVGRRVRAGAAPVTRNVRRSPRPSA